MQEIKIFENEEFGEIRTVVIDGEPWFVANDVAKALGYVKPRDAIKTNVDDMDTTLMGVIDSMGRNQQTSVINESGLYSLIFGSKLDTAKTFKRWVTAEVLPSIRKTGTYSSIDRVDAAILKGAASAGCLVERTMKAEGARAYETATVLDSLFKQSGIILPDCFIKIPEYEQMVLPCVKK